MQSDDTAPAEAALAPASLTHADRWALGAYRIAFELAALMLSASFALRIVLLVDSGQLRSVSWMDVARILATGLRFDLLVTLFSLIPLVLYLSCWRNPGQKRFQRLILEATWSTLFFLLPFLCVLEFLFFQEFDSRLNYIVFEYVVYPTEVCCNIQQSYPIGSLLIGVGLVGTGLCLSMRPRFLRSLQSPASPSILCAFPVGAIALAAVLWATTSASDADVTSNRVANECAANGVFSFVDHAWTCRFEFDRLYLTLEPEEANTRVRKRVELPGDQFVANAVNPLDRTVETKEPQQDHNVVVILEESLGSDHVGALGGSPLTPCFDALCREGLLFDNFYATGNRTARALEAVLTSLPPIPTESILKRDHSSHVYTLANVLAERGYERLFMTGGRGLFDGVRTFMTSNGFNHFREQSDFDNPTFTNAWGVSDEDLFRGALRELDQLAGGKKPFFATLLTVSNHRPFTFPSDRVPDETQTGSRESAVRYADWGLGEFFREARQKPWYRNTIFVVMGDHGARVYGKQLFPLRSYRVPVLLIRPDQAQAGKRCHTLGCSIDIAPTIMGRLGGKYASVFFGRDLATVGPGSGYAVMQHNHSVALLDAQNMLTVLDSGKRISLFEVESASFQLRPLNVMTRADWDVAAVFQTAYSLYYSEQCHPIPRDSEVDRRARLGVAMPPPLKTKQL
ncbi:MAG: sulfatase-like hydrolase/transferase [Planctomycetaceae bacterium]|nr:sulfatase-like hydrolase/transferase [Planctomycetaceae bacterium]